MRWPRPDVLSRFAGYKPPCELVNIMTLPSGYTQLNNGQYAPSPLLAAQDPSVGAFIRGTAIYAGWDRHSEYITTDTASAAIGSFQIGESPLGYIRAYHGTLTFSTVGFGGIGEFAIGIDAIGVGGSYPVLTDTPWPALSQLTVFYDVAAVSGYSGINLVEVNWGQWPFAVGRGG